MITDIYEADQPAFKDTGGGGDSTEYIASIPDEEIDQMSVQDCRKELNRRGYSKPPYNVCLALSADKTPGLVEKYGAAMKVAIAKEGENPVYTIAGKGDATSASETAEIQTAIEAAVGKEVAEDFADGVPKVRKLNENEGRGLLKLIGHDPRFKDGQPVTQPSYYKRECRNLECCALFWVYWVGMLIVAIIGLSTGDPYRLIRPIDYNGDTCGGAEVPGKEQMYYPQMAADALKMYQDSEYASTCADSVSGCFYGVCTDGCPSKGEYLCTYETQAAIDTLCAGSRVESVSDCVVRNQEDHSGNGCWVVQMNSIEIFKRCLPWEPSTVETSYSCDTTYTTELGETVTNSVDIRSDNCPCGGPDMLDCVKDGAIDDGSEVCLNLMYDSCTGTSTVAATCVGSLGSDSSDCAAVDAFVASGAEADCPTVDGCTYTKVPLCDMDAATDGTAVCPAGCDQTVVEDPGTTCTLNPAVLDDDDVPTTDGSCTKDSGDGFCTYHADSAQEACPAGVMSMKLQLGCTTGVIHRVVVEEAEYTEGTEDMSASLTSYTAWVAQAGSDVYNSTALIIIMGPVLAALVSFAFIFFMSYFAGVLIWTTLITLQFVFIAATLFMSWQCGYLQDALEGLINTTSTETGNSTWSAVAGDGATTAQAFLEGYSAFGETDEEATESNETIWMIAFWVCLIFTVVYFFCLLGLRKQIKLAIELIKEAGRTIRKMPMCLLYPMFTYAMTFIMFLYFLFIATYIITTSATIDSLQETYQIENATFDLDTALAAAETLQAEIESNNTIVAYNSTEAESNNLVRGLFVYHLFGFFWVSEFIKAIGMLTIAGAVCSDYWITNPTFRPSSPVFSAFFRSIRYHAGSAVYGAAIIAIIRLWRAIMMYVDQQTQQLQKGNKAAQIAMKLIHCCLWCLEKIARYISNAAYIMIAIEGRGFCVSAWRSFKLLFSNSLRIAATETIALLIITLANLGIVACCVMLTMLCLNNLPMYTCIGLDPGEECTLYVDNALIPAIFVGITSFMIAYCFMQVYGMAITTILLSFCLDEDKYKDGQYKTKLNDEGEPDARMFCVINKKIGLISLVSGNIAEEQKALEAQQEAFAIEQAKMAMKGAARP